MKKRIIIITIILTLTIGIIYETIGIYKTLTNKSNIDELTQVNVNELKDNKNLAIMVKSSSEDEYSEMKSRDSWPEYPKYIYMKAECDDGNGSKLVGTNVINYDEKTNKLTMTTKTTLYCTLYFAEPGDAYSLLVKQGGDTFKTVPSDSTMHRFVGEYGTVKNNYICFGTTNQGDCIENPDKYMYRIIGVVTGENDLNLKVGQIKVIKATPLKEDNGNVKTMGWTNPNSDFTWDYTDTTSSSGAILRYYLNNDFYSAIQEPWKSKITTQQWYKGNDTQATSATGITNEKKQKTNDSKNTAGYPIGLMYVSDYYNSWTYVTNTKSWLHITHGTGSSSTYSNHDEWTMTWYGFHSAGNSYRAWRVEKDGSLEYTGFPTATLAVRPVFYLSPDVKLSGLGTEDEPFIIS